MNKTKSIKAIELIFFALAICMWLGGLAVITFIFHGMLTQDTATQNLSDVVKYGLLTFLGLCWCFWFFVGIYNFYREYNKLKAPQDVEIEYHCPKRLEQLRILKGLRHHKGQVCITSIGSIVLISMAMVDIENMNPLTIIFPLGFVYSFLNVKALNKKRAQLKS